MPAPIKTKTISIPVGLLVILVLTFVVYWPSLRGEFLWDDDVLLTNNAHMIQPGGLKAIWLGKDTPDYFPLTLTTLWLEHKFFGLNPVGYHVVNVLLHALGAVLLWRVVLRLRIPGAFAAALIFAVHPFCVSSVAWIAERKNTLSLVFYLLTLLCFLKSLAPREARSAPDGKLDRFWYSLSLIAFVGALLSKTSVVMLPFVLALCVWWMNEKASENLSATMRLLLSWSNVRTLAPYFALSLVFGVVTTQFQGDSEIFGASDPALVRILGGGMAGWFYLSKALLPLNLTMIYPRWEVSSMPGWISWGLWPVVAGVAWRFRSTWGKLVLFALGYFLITLLPVLGFFNMSFFAFSRVADHLAYLSIIGIIVLAAGTLTVWLRKTGGATIAIGIILVVFSVMTWNRAEVFASAEKLWRDTLNRNPKAWAACNHLGEILAHRGDVEQSLGLFRKAVELNPNYAYAHFNLGTACAAMQQTEEAIRHFEQALRIWPDYAEAENGWGLALLNSGDVGKAIQHFRASLKYAPRYVDAHFNLAIALARNQAHDEAIKHFEFVLANKPDDASARDNLERVLAEKQKANKQRESRQEP